MFCTGRRIKSPERGLLALHPFVDVLEGRSLMTATAAEGLIAVGSVMDARPPDAARSPWSVEDVVASAGDAHAAPARTAASQETAGKELAARTTPGVVRLDPATSLSAFGNRPIADGPWTLFAGALHDRRGRADAPPLPTPEQVEAARAAASNADAPDAEFRDGRSLAGAMMPFLTMTLDQSNHPFAA